MRAFATVQALPLTVIRRIAHKAHKDFDYTIVITIVL